VLAIITIIVEVLIIMRLFDLKRIKNNNDIVTGKDIVEL